MHLIGVFIYGGLTLCGLFAFAAIQGSTAGMASAIVATGFAWLAQNWNEGEFYNAALLYVVVAVGSSGASLASSLGLFA